MPSAESKLAEDVLGVLLDLFPLGSVAKSAFKIPVGYFLDRVDRGSKDRSFTSIAAAIAEELSGSPDQDNPGAARSAAYDVVHILQMSQLSPTLLVELNIDAQFVLSHLTAIGATVLETASAQRKGFIVNGLQKFSEAVVESAPNLPGVPLAFMQAMLKSRSTPSRTET